MKRDWGIYVHIPFCRKKCLYCDFASFAGAEEEIPSYMDALCRELKMVLPKATNLYGAPQTLYIGGGTPSLLPIREIEKVFLATYEFAPRENFSEITVEGNPESLTSEKLAAYREFGANRLSVGVQSFNDRLLQIIGRVHSGKDAVLAVENAKQAGFFNISVDIIYALPEETLKDLKRDLATAAGLNIPHISVYGLTAEEGTPLHKRLQKGEIMLPSEDDEEAMYDLVANFLPSRGFNRYEVSNYAKPGFESKHNSLYWRYAPYAGAGLSASGFLLGERYKNTSDLTEYVEKLSRGESVGEKEPRSQKDAIFEFVFLGLRTSNGVSKEGFQKEFDIELESLYGKKIESLARQNLVVSDSKSLRLTKPGVKIGNMIFAEFIL